MSSRSVPSIEFTSWPTIVGSDGTPKTKLLNWTFDGLLASEGHSRRPNGGWSGGGAFYAHHASCMHGDANHITQTLFGNTEHANFAGCGLVNANPPGDLGSLINHAAFDASGWGLKGYNRTKPGRPIADSFVSVKELATDGLPGIPFRDALFRGKRGFLGLPSNTPLREIPDRLKKVLKDPAYSGDQYLNIVFGWKPIVSDIRKLYRAMKTADSAIRKLASQNGQNVRRRALLSDTSSTVVEMDGLSQQPWVNVNGAPAAWSAGTTRTAITTTTTSRSWYSAMYRYWIPDLPQWQLGGRAKRALFGVNPTPGAIYAALPWTWLADWFVSFGDIADALSPTAVDGLAQLYGYSMLHDVVIRRGTCEVSYQGQRSAFANVPPWSGTLSSVVKTERKIRAGGFNPFGPNVSLDSLSTGQAAILAALGLSKGFGR